MRYEDVSAYVAKHVGEGDELLAWVRRKSQELGRLGVFPVDPTRGRLLELLARMHSARRVLEIGSGAGYSALWFLRGMTNDGMLDAIEVNQEVSKVLEMVLKKARLEGRVRIHTGPALSLLQSLTGLYDIVFIDADKDEYADYLENAFRLTGPGSVIVADNMLWGGATVQGNRHKEGVQGILEYARRIFSDPRLSSIIVPLGDGLAVSYRVE